ncbi:MAG: heme-dependent oxidative N-demethylase family protein [Actinomycetota bacterium]
MTSFVAHQNPFTPFDTAPREPAHVGRIPHDDIIPQLIGDSFRHRVGVKPLDLANWFVYDGEWEPTIEMKRELLAQRHESVLAFRDDAHDVAQEAAELVLAWVGKSTEGRGVDALVDAALAVPDDLTVLRSIDTPDGEQLPFVAGVVCSPSRWRLTEKIGLDMLAVHKPVALYAEHIGAAVDTTLTRLSPEKPIWRSNWTLEDHPALFQPFSPDRPLVEHPSDLWIRIERETLRRLPRTRGILFTIRGFQEPLSTYVTRGPEAVRTLRELVARLPDALARYKSVYDYRSATITWLDSLLASDIASLR